MDFIVTLSGLERLGIICNWVPPIQCVGLFKNSAGYKCASISNKPEWPVMVGERQYGRGCESGDEGSKSSFLSIPPKKWGVFTCQF